MVIQEATTVARSSTEAEYKALANAAAETNWIVNLLKELHFSISNISMVCCDNLGATFCLKPNLPQRSHEASCSEASQGQNTCCTTCSFSQLADSLTKVVPTTDFCCDRSKIGVVPSPRILRGHNKEP